MQVQHVAANLESWKESASQRIAAAELAEGACFLLSMPLLSQSAAAACCQLRERVCQAETALQESQAKLSGLDVEFRTVKAKADAGEATIKGMQMQHDSLTTQLSEISELRNASVSALEESLVRVKDLQSLVRAKEDSLECLRGEMGNQVTMRLSLEADLEDTKANLQRREDLLCQANESLHLVHQQIQECEAELTSKETKLEESRSLVDTFKLQMQDTAAAQAAAEVQHAATISMLQAQLAELQGCMSAAVSDRDTNIAQLQSSAKAVSEAHVAEQQQHAAAVLTLQTQLAELQNSMTAA
eukprot:356721-Chlamydomonas_euryale.AAC.10